MITYSIDYQFMPKGSKRPQDEGEVVGIEGTSEKGQTILPNVGDYVFTENSTNEFVKFKGKVRSRTFFYVRSPDKVHCHVNIVVEETDDDWGALIKQ
jgi:hypothetical protein